MINREKRQYTSLSLTIPPLLCLCRSTWIICICTYPRLVTIRVIRLVAFRFFSALVWCNVHPRTKILADSVLLFSCWAIQYVSLCVCALSSLIFIRSRWWTIIRRINCSCARSLAVARWRHLSRRMAACVNNERRNGFRWWYSKDWLSKLLSRCGIDFVSVESFREDLPMSNTSDNKTGSTANSRIVRVRDVS